MLKASEFEACLKGNNMNSRYYERLIHNRIEKFYCEKKKLLNPPPDYKWDFDDIIKVDKSEFSIFDSKLIDCLKLSQYNIYIDAFYTNEFKQNALTLDIIFGNPLFKAVIDDLNIVVLDYIFKPDIIKNYSVFSVKKQNQFIFSDDNYNYILYLDSQMIPPFIDTKKRLVSFCKILVIIRNYLKRYWHQIAFFKTIDLIVKPILNMPLHYYYISSLIQDLNIINKKNGYLKTLFLKKKNYSGLPFILAEMPYFFFNKFFSIDSMNSLLFELDLEFQKMTVCFSAIGINKTLPVEDFRLNVFKQIMMEVGQEFPPADETKFISNYISGLITSQNHESIRKMKSIISKWFYISN